MLDGLYSHDHTCSAKCNGRLGTGKENIQMIQRAPVNNKACQTNTAPMLTWRAHPHWGTGIDAHDRQGCCRGILADVSGHSTSVYCWLPCPQPYTLKTNPKPYRFYKCLSSEAVQHAGAGRPPGFKGRLPADLVLICMP